MIEILTSGLMNSVQDLGRPFYLDQGIGRGGVMDRTALRVANLLVGNDEAAAGLEISIFPFRLRFLAPSFFAVTGADARVTLNGATLPAWWGRTAEAGDELRINPSAKGARAVIAFSGGIDVPLVLGSRATDLKSIFGGLEGRALLRGDRLPLLPSAASPKHLVGHGADPSALRDPDATRLRVMIGAEFDAFTPEAREAFASLPYRVSRENNRQGMRLDGPALALSRKLELFSHGIMPGTVQVPPSGQPVIQLAEANTCGGYPKIAHVIEPDHWKLAQAPSGTEFTFVPVSRQEAVAAIRREELEIRRLKNVLPVVMAPARKVG
jgi:biotin-dependent carboxylase-like uncharacterized protein